MRIGRGRVMVFAAAAVLLASGGTTAHLPAAVAVSSSSSVPGADAGADGAAGAEARHVPGRVLVRAVDPAAVGRAHGLGPGVAVGRTGFVAMPTNGRDAVSVRNALRADRRVLDAELDYIRTIDATPNDPYFGLEQREFLTVRLPDAWDLVKAPSSRVVAVLDTGADLDHPDLVGRLTSGWDFVDDDPQPQDEHGHGTLVSGVVGATANNGRGVAGATWGASVMPVRVLGANGEGIDSDVALGITWAVDNGASVVNLSLSGEAPSALLRTAADYAEAANVVLVAAAGNRGTEQPSYPAAYETVLAVGATDDGGNHAAFSQRGTWLDVVAPGVGIAGPMLGPGEAYSQANGTSFAAPIAAAAAALVRTQFGTYTAANVRGRLGSTALDRGAPGFDTYYGRGLLDVAAAVTAAARSGYWMTDSGGFVYAFGDARHMGALNGARENVVDLEPTRSGNGYWLLTGAGEIYGYGDAAHRGQPSGLPPGEVVTSMSAHPGGAGYWVFTSRGRVFPYGGAPFHGDMSGTVLNGPVLDSVATPTGDGYYMVASDGGIFAFGDAKFHGSMGGRPLNAPVQSLVPDGDSVGYWLVASDGGVFAFEAPFRGSMGGQRLNRPITGMVRFGDGYLMVAEDGGVFNFSNKPFHGSLGSNPPPRPVVTIAALER